MITWSSETTSTEGSTWHATIDGRTYRVTNNHGLWNVTAPNGATQRLAQHGQVLNDAAVLIEHHALKGRWY